MTTRSYGIEVEDAGLRLCFAQESRAVARKPRDAAAVLFGLKFADNIHYRFKSSKLRKTCFCSPKFQNPNTVYTGATQNLTQSGHVLESRERRSGT